MKKFLLSLVILICCVATAVAESVSPAAARAVAAEFLQSRGAAVTAEEVATPRGGRAAADDPSPAYYVFNADAAKGFVVVSGDDCVGDNLVLGYAAEGSFSSDNMPDGLQWWLDATAESISRLSAQGARAARVATHPNIAPMVTSHWDQGFPYNALCPTSGGQLCITGCMATALAQVMRYHRWPQDAVASSLPAYTMANGNEIPGLPATQFDWGNMTDDYSSASSTAAQMEAVATLMRYCGQSMQMDYTPQLSTAVCYDIDLLVNSFGYDPALYEAQANEYSVSDWDALLYNELQYGRPLVYGGQSTGGGHAFVLDGYQVQSGVGYYHVNWGWGGTADGFYKINLLNANGTGSGASTTPDGYSYAQRALINFMPRVSASDPFHRKFSSFEWNVQTANGPRFSVINESWRSGKILLAIIGRNSDGTPDLTRIYYVYEYDCSGFTTASLISGVNMKSVISIVLSDAVCHSLFDGQTPGSHDVMFVCQESGTSRMYPIYGPDAHLETVIGSDGKFESLIVHPRPALSASPSDISIEGLLQRGFSQTVTANVLNRSESYIGALACHLYSLNNGVLTSPFAKSNAGIMAEPGKRTAVPFSISAPQAGEYVLVLMSITNYTMDGTPLAQIAQQPGYITHKLVTIDEMAMVCNGVTYVERTDVHEQLLYQLDVAMYNGTPLNYDAFLPVDIFRKNTSGEWEPVVFPGVSTIYSAMTVAAGAKSTVSLSLPEALSKGEYVARLNVANDFLSGNPNNYFVLASVPFTVGETGINEVESDELRVKSEESDAPIYDLMGRRLSEKPASGYYIRGGKKYLIP